jgi:hypothetical protein
MNYLAQGLDTGFRVGAEARENKKKRERDEAQAKAEREMRMDLQARQLAQQQRLQELDQLFRGTEGEKDRTFRTGERVGSETFQGGLADKDRIFRSSEADKDRGFRTGEREAGQTFTAGQSQLDRDARQVSLDKELTQRGQLTATDQALREKEFGYKASPTNPLNKYYDALATAQAGAPLGEMAATTPYSSKISELEKQISEQKLEQATGDQRTGLFNWKSRDSVVDDSQQQILKLKGLELQHLVESGAISREEAARRAAKLLGR